MNPRTALIGILLAATSAAVVSGAAQASILQLDSDDKTSSEWRPDYLPGVITQDGSVAWWDGWRGTSTPTLIAAPHDFTRVYSDSWSLAAVRRDGTVLGIEPPSGVACTAGSEALTDVVSLASVTCGYAALRRDGTVTVFGGDPPVLNSPPSDVAAQLTNVQKLFTTQDAFAALRGDGSVVTWGNATRGGDSSAVAADLNGTIDVVDIVASDNSFAALRTDGSVVTWGEAGQFLPAAGSQLANDLAGTGGSGGIVRIFATSARESAQRPCGFAGVTTGGATIVWSSVRFTVDSTESASYGIGPGADVQAAAAGPGRCPWAFLRGNGTIAAVGDARNGGVLSSATHVRPADRTALETPGNVVEVKNGGQTFVARLSNGGLVEWPITHPEYFVQPPSGTGFTKVVRAYSGYVGVKANGTVEYFGGTLDRALSPEEHTLLVGVTDVRPRSDGFLALRGDGTVVEVKRGSATRVVPVADVARMISPLAPFTWTYAGPAPSPPGGGGAPPDAGAPSGGGGAPPLARDPEPTPNPPVATPQANPAPAPVVVAPGITVGATFNTANLDASTPAAPRDLLRAAQANLPARATITFVLKSLPKGLRVVGGRLVADTPGTYVVQLKVKRKNGKVGTRRVKVVVG